MKVLVKKVPNLVLPSRANTTDAAYDVIAASDPHVEGRKIDHFINGISQELWGRIDYIEYKTGLYLAPQDVKSFSEPFDPLKVLKFHLEGFARSSISKKNLVLANCVATLDNGYRGEVSFRYKYILQPEDLVFIPEQDGVKLYTYINGIYNKGDKIAQLKARLDSDIEFELVDSLDDTVRGAGGFGSSGK